jgi:predicted nuclease of predicted toxin-antitoxin system
MIFWIDAQLSPALAPWITSEFGVEAYSVKWLGYRDAEDCVIFQAAHQANAVVVTKDSDFLRLLDEFGPPPQIVWITQAIPQTPTCAMYSGGYCRRPSLFLSWASRSSKSAR